MYNFDMENIDKLLEIHQIWQFFPGQSFVPYGSYICVVSYINFLLYLHIICNYIRSDICSYIYIRNYFCYYLWL